MKYPVQEIIENAKGSQKRFKTKRRSNMKHPLQKIIIDDNGTPRFRANTIVEWLLETGNADMNQIAGQNFSKADLRQFAQLAGYSTSAYGGLSYAQESKSANIADKKSLQMLKAAKKASKQ